MKRITEKFLEAQVSSLNTIILNNPNPEWSEIGSFDLDYAYGGVQLIRYTSTKGTCIDILNTGHVPKRELSEKIYAFELGLTFEK